jgi:acetyl-CoA acetyltransferase
MGRLARGVDIVGVATTAYGRFLERPLSDLAREAAEGAVVDAGLTAAAVEAVVFGNAAEGVMTGQEMIRGQVALSGTGFAGLPILNTENACASGSAAFHLAVLMVASGRYDCVLAVGAEKLHHVDKARSFAAIMSGIDQSLDTSGAQADGSVMMGFYANEARQYMHSFGPLDHALAAVSVKNRSFAAANLNAQFRSEITIDQVLDSRLVADPLRLLMCAPMTDGASAVLVRARDCPDGVRAPVSVVGTEGASYRRGSSVVRRAAQRLYAQTGASPTDVKVWQLHDACSFAEIAQYELVGIARLGEGARAALDGRTGREGDAPVNTDGGLLSRGHPLGATGIAQLVELTAQVRGEAGSGQITAADTGLAVNGAGWMGDDYAACFTTLLTRA